MSFLKSNLQRRLVVTIFCMAVFPILISSIIGNFWFQKTLKKSTDKELTLTNELLSDRIERDLRYLQETMSVAFRGFNQSYTRGQRNRGSQNGRKEAEERENQTILTKLMNILDDNLQRESSASMRQDLVDLINNPELFRSVHVLDRDGKHLGGHDITADPENGEQIFQPSPHIDFSTSADFLAFQKLVMDTIVGPRAPEKFPSKPLNNQKKIFGVSSFLNDSYISDVQAATDADDNLIEPIIPVINIWALNRGAIRPGNWGNYQERIRPGAPLFIRLELNAQDFFEQIVTNRPEIDEEAGEVELDYVGIPSGDYLLHPDSECVMCSLGTTGSLSWKDDFPDLVTGLVNTNSYVNFDPRNNRVVAAQKIYYDETDDSRHWLLIRSIPMEQVLSAVTNLRKLTVILVLIMVVVVVPATLWITRGLTKPIRALVTATDKIAEGDLETDIPIRAEDELGQLADSYEKMKGQIRNMIQYLKDRQTVAESANKAKSTFLANMSHELRTPLNGILGYAQILKQSPDLTPKQTEGVNVILRSGEHLLSLINDILDLSKVEAGRMELHPVDFSLKDLLENLSRIMDLRARQKKIQFNLEIKGKLPELVNGDDSRLRQVLMNLLSNAVKFTDKGQVSLIVQAEDGDQGINFQVKDTGHGISHEHIESIFSPFQQVGRVDRMTEGTGLGLAISRKLTQMLGGELKVNSKVGKGSLFYFTIHLPEVSQTEAQFSGDTTMYWMGTGVKDAKKFSAAKKAAKDHRKIVGYEGRRLKVMVVDDKIENRTILNELLSPLGFELSEAFDGQQAIDMTPEVMPDVILMDLRMPRCDGYEATRKIRELKLNDNLLIITISASAFASNRSESLNAGANDFIPKPVRRSLLLETIHQHLDIKWVYDGEEAAVETNPILPDPGVSKDIEIKGDVSEACCENLDQLIDLAKRGNLKGLEIELSEFVEKFPHMQPIENSLRPLIKGFKLKEVNQLLQSTRADIAKAAEAAI